MGDAFDARAVRRTYDAVAEAYAAKFGYDLDDLRFDRQLLDEVAPRAGSGGPVLDIGCGPGQVAGYLTARGVRAVGVDLSPNALSIARRRSAGSGFVAADMRRLPVRTGSCAGIVAFYSLHHLARKEVPAGLDELRRVAAPGATLLIATHEGEGEAFSEADWLGQHVEVMGATLFTADELDVALSEAAFTVDHMLHRDPLPHEYQGPRIYVTATAVGSGD